MTLRRGCLWLAAGLLLALIAGVATFVTIQRLAAASQQVEEPPLMEVVVAARDVPVHAVIGPEDVRVQAVPPEIVPPDGLTDLQEALGQLTTTDLAQGEIILKRRLLKPDYVGPRAAFVMDPKRVIVAFPASDLLGNLDIVRPGDHVDLMFSYDFSKASEGMGINTFSAFQDVEVAAVVRAPASGQQAGQPSAGQPQAFLFALDPQDALALKHLRDTGGSADLALRSPAAEGEFDVEPVDGDYLLSRYLMRRRATP